MLMVKKDQLHSRIEILIKKICDQNMLLAVTNPLRVVERIADHSDRNPVAVLLPVVVALVDLCQIRAVGQVVDRRKINPLFTRASTFTPRAIICFQSS